MKSAQELFTQTRGSYPPPIWIIIFTSLAMLATGAAPAMGQTAEFDPATMTVEESRDLVSRAFSARTIAVSPEDEVLSPFISALDTTTQAATGPPVPKGVPVPGAPTPWEAEQTVATYSSVNLANGNLLTVLPITGWSGKGPDVDFSLYHNSADGVWRMSYIDRTLFGDGTTVMVVVTDDGRQVAFFYDVVAQEWVPQSGYHWEFGHHESLPVWEVTFKDQSKWRFDDATLKFTTEIDSAGHELTVSEDTSGSDPIHTIEDATGQGRTLTVTFKTDPDPVCKTVEIDDFSGRHWVLTFDSCASPRKLTKLKDAMGFDIIVTQYDTEGRILRIKDKESHEFTYAYDDFGYPGSYKLSQVTDPAPGSQVQWLGYVDLDPPNDTFSITRYYNRRGHPIDYWFNIGVIDGVFKMFWMNAVLINYSRMFDADHNVVEYFDGYSSWFYTYDDQGNRLTRTSSLNSLTETWEYDPLNNVTAYINAEGGTNGRFEFTYNYNGPDDPTDPSDPTVPTVVTLPPLQTGGSQPPIILTYHDGTAGTPLGQLESVTDANGVLTVYNYDELGYLERETEGDAASSTPSTVYIDHDFDNLGRSLRSVRDGECVSGPGAASSLTGGNGYDLNGRLTTSTCVVEPNPPGGASACGLMNPEPEWIGFFEPSSTFTYDHMGRWRTAYTQLVGIGDGVASETVSRNEDSAYDEIGRLKSHGVDTDEPTYRDLQPGPWISNSVSYGYDDLLGTTTRTSTLFPNRTIVSTTDVMGRLLVQELKDASGTVLGQANYEYSPQNLIAKITYDYDDQAQTSGFTSEFHYNVAARLVWVKHTEKDAANPYLQLDYAYNVRGLITQIIETDEFLVQTTLTFTYDNWGRLLSERRVGANPYDLAYTYDAGGNRLTKTDAFNERLTTYYYDTDTSNLPTWIEPPGSRANRLLGYEETTIAVPPNLSVRVKYDYFMEGHAAGNVAQIRHLYRNVVEVDGTVTESNYFARGTTFEYNKMGELWIAKQREWNEVHSYDSATGVLTVLPIDVADVTTKDVVEFRGVGRKRYMVRHRATAWPHFPLFDSAVWTDYEGVNPLGDYTVTVTGQSPNIVATQTAGQFYALGFAQADAAGQVLYEHADHIGSAREMSDAAGTVQKTFVYTAFGEPIYESGTFETRYQYAGKHGYESFGNFGSNFPFPYMHVGARWYDPGTGRFLQRDPNGLVLTFDSLEQPTRVPGDLNVYQYAASSPTMALDPDGEAWWIFRAAGIAGKWVWRGGKWVLNKGVKKAQKVTTSCLRRMNKGKWRVGLSAHKNKVYFSLRWKQKHIVDVPIPKWFENLY